MTLIYFRIIVSIFVPLFLFPSQSSEVDSFTDRNKNLMREDSYHNLNKFTELRLAEAGNLANDWSGGDQCIQAFLEEGVLERLSGRAVPYFIGPYYTPMWVYGINGELETAVDKGLDSDNKFKFDVAHIKKGKSIYRDIGLWESFPISKVIGSVVNFQGLIIGSDKFGHFISEGYEYYLLGGTKKLRKILNYGEILEAGVLGLKTSGVFSHGDLAANLMGLIFWESLVGGRKPYFKCNSKGAWYRTKRKFDWNDYVSPAWDEAINPSLYYSKTMWDKIKKEIIKLQKGNKKNLTPPVSVKGCFDSIRFFHRQFREESIAVINSVISPVCLEFYRKNKKGKWEDVKDKIPGEQKEFMGPTWWIFGKKAPKGHY